MALSIRIGNATQPNKTKRIAWFHADRNDDRDKHDPDPRLGGSPALHAIHLRARESVLRQDLFTLRSVISQFTLDKQRAPQTLDDLVQAGYIKQIPIDPFTSKNDTWQLEQEDVLLAVDQQQPGITDVHSGANLTASDGTNYTSW
jgi:general secretion pathway protein G